MGRKKLSEPRRRFVEAYMGEAKGNATQAAAMTYNTTNRDTLRTMGSDLMREPAVIEAIEERIAQDPLVMGREERQRTWTSIARGEGVDGDGKPPSWRDRLSALKTLGRAQGDFIERIEHKGEVVGGITYDLSFSDPREPEPELDFSGLSPDERLALFELLNKADETSKAKAIDMDEES